MSAHLPDFSPQELITMAPAPKEFLAREFSSGFPPIVKLSDDALCIDWFRVGETVIMKVFANRDHPNMTLLPDNAPRIVKQLYRREYQLSLARCRDILPHVILWRQAEDAWAKYWQARGDVQ